MSIHLGTSGFSFPDWKGPVYPKAIKNIEMLGFYANELKFTSVEVNFTYYALPSEKSFISMQSRVPRDFSFAVKAFRGTTHDPFDARILRKPSIIKAYEATKQFAGALTPLVTAKQLGCVLLQFPYFFPCTDESKEYILKIRDLLNGVPVVVEFRNANWATPDTIKFLMGHKLGYCAVDEAKLPQLMPYNPEVTSKIGFLRFHGRNPNWFNAPMEERYNYLYNEEELKAFIPDIKKMSNRCSDLFIYFNNCHQGFAVKNADIMRRLIAQYIIDN